MLNPERAPNGHRLYWNADITTVERVLALIMRGARISKVKPLLVVDPSITLTSGEGDDWEKLFAQLVAAAEQYPLIKVERVLKNTLQLPGPSLRERLLQTVFVNLSGKHSEDAALCFLVSELIRYVLMRLSARVSTNADASSVILIPGIHTPIWPLALMTMELRDSDVKYYLLTRPLSIRAAIRLALNPQYTQAVFYQDGVWKENHHAVAAGVLLKNDSLRLCGNAPMLAGLTKRRRVLIMYTAVLKTRLSVR